MKQLLVTSFLCFLCFVSAKAQATYAEEGVGIVGVTVGKSTLPDVTAVYGEDYELIAHDKYSYEARYSNGLAFWFCQADTAKKIFALMVSPPYFGITGKGIVVGESTIADVFRLYGETGRLTTEAYETWFFSYKGIQFHAKFDPLEDDDELSLEGDDLKLFLKRKIIRIEIEPANKKGNACSIDGSPNNTWSN